jgi:hypothetical protein
MARSCYQPPFYFKLWEISAPMTPKVAEYNQYLRYNVRNSFGGDGFLEWGVFTKDYTFTLTCK